MKRFALPALIAIVVIIALVSLYLWSIFPYPPAIVAVLGGLIYVVLAWIDWPLDVWLLSHTLCMQSEQMGNERIYIGSSDENNERRVSWRDLTQSEHARLLINLHGHYLVTEGFTLTAQSVWKAGIILSGFVLVGAVVVYLDGSHARVWPGSYKETIITGCIVFFFHGAILMDTLLRRRQNSEVQRATRKAIIQRRASVTSASMNSPNDTLALFTAATHDLLEWIKKSTEGDTTLQAVAELLTELRRNSDVTNTRIDAKMSDKPYYDHHRFERLFSFSQGYLEHFEKHLQQRGAYLQRISVLYHFMLHEFIHIWQGVDSYRYQYTDYAQRLLLPIDYHADALAALTLHELYNKHKPPEWAPGEQWNIALGEIMRATILDLEVFASFQGPYPLQSLGWFNFHRFLQWHFQYARARQYEPEGHSVIDLDLLALPVLALGGEEGHETGYVPAMSFRMPQLLVVSWKGRLYPFSSENEKFAALLLEGLLSGDLNQSGRLFADFFGTHPIFVGRTLNRQPHLRPN